MKAWECGVGVSLCAMNLFAGEWLEHRGPSGQGVVHLWRESQKEWSSDKNILWKSSLDGKAWSTPLIKGNRIYLTNAIEKEPISRAMCLDLETGEVIWDKEIFSFKGEVICHKKNSHASSSPII